MSKYLVAAKDAAGHIFNEIVEASDQDQAVRQIQGKGLFVTAVKKLAEEYLTWKPSASPASKRKFSRDKASLEDVISFARQLATMLESGIPLLRAIVVISDQVESRELAHVLEEVVADVEQGQPFSRSIAKHPRIFSAFWVSLVEVGEASGTMPKILEKLTVYMEDAAAFRSTIIGVLIYPAVLFVICVGAVIFFAVFVGPTFERVFKDMNITLPPLTQAMMVIFKLIKEQFLLLFAGAIGIFFVFSNYIRTRSGRRGFEEFLFHMPVFGRVVKLIVVEKFTSQMAILMDSGVPILYALEIAERLVDNSVCAEVIKDVREGVREGKLLADPMEQSGFFPSMAVQMIRVGEETGELGKMLNHVAVYYKRNVGEFLKRFGILIEPVMLVVMGAIIGTIVIAMFLPMLTMSTGG